MSIQDVTSGYNIIGHVVTAAALSEAISSVTVWVIQTFGHVDVPVSIGQAFSVIGVVGASVLLKKIGAQ